MGNQSHRIISGLTIFLMVAVVAAGWFLIAQPQVAAAQAGGGQLSAAQSQISTAQAQLTALKAAKGKLPELKAKLASLRQSIPDNLDAAAFIREVSSLADAQGVKVTAVDVSDAVLYAAPGASATSTPVASPSASASPTPSASATAAPSTAAAETEGWSAPTDPAISSSDFATIPLSVTFNGPWSQVTAFVSALQTGQRLYLVNKLDGHGASDGSFELTTTGLLYATIDASAPKTMTGLTTDKKSASTTPRKSTPSPKSTADPSSSPSATPTESSAPHE
jgi:Tfp pilus assembly protein PilO